VFDGIQGLAFPFRIDPATGGVAVARGADKIRQNVRIVLGVRLGERPMLRDFGTRLAAMVHEPNDDVVRDVLQNQVRQALLQWEPRIMVADVRVTQEEGEATVVLNYVATGEPRISQMLLPLA
jgi:phage baseplate assembly protein W